MYGMSLQTWPSNLKSAALTVLELLLNANAFNAQKFRGSRDPGHALLSKNFKASCPDCPWKHVAQNLKSIALTVLELLTFNGPKFRGSRDPGTPISGATQNSWARTRGAQLTAGSRQRV